MHVLGRRPPYGILKLDVHGEIAEEPMGQRLLDMLQPHRDDFFSLVVLLRWAREDPRLRAVFVRCDDLRLGWARTQELRRSLVALRRAGKAVWVHLAYAGVREYVLASAADKITLAPAGMVDVTGLASEVTFVAGTLQKLGIQIDLVQMGKYKSAAETLTRQDMSEPHREMVESVLHDLYEQVVDLIAEGRHLAVGSVRHLLDRGPFTAQEAEQAQLVDALLYDDEAEERLRAQCEQQTVIERRAYFSRRARAARRAVLRQDHPAIGLLHVTGPIKTGQTVAGPGAAGACGAATVARDLKALRERPQIGAVVVRIASPGGSGLASDLIWHEVSKTAQQKPVVVSLGDVAASGGYYVAVAGNLVLAEAGTITGSIGVLAGKAVLKDLYEQIGVTKQLIVRGRHAALHSDYVPLGAEERQRLQAEAESFYAGFISKVSCGRQLESHAVAAVAEGRVWTGSQAKNAGLVDQLGGLEEALDQAKVLAGVAANVRIAVERFPRRERLWKLPWSLNPGSSRLQHLNPWMHMLGSGERLWAILPFHISFF
ncbi:MAG: signal peptide peptidase SppA [Deltaproteobacteria bacterium]|nr:signal peptide peptidase SppA [Deltaproteobacteria bacterium]